MSISGASSRWAYVHPRESYKMPKPAGKLGARATIALGLSFEKVIKRHTRHYGTKECVEQVELLIFDVTRSVEDVAQLQSKAVHHIRVCCSG